MPKFRSSPSVHALWLTEPLMSQLVALFDNQLSERTACAFVHIVVTGVNSCFMCTLHLWLMYLAPEPRPGSQCYHVPTHRQMLRTEPHPGKARYVEVLGGKQCSICLHVLRAWAGTHIKSHESSNKHKEAIYRREVRQCRVRVGAGFGHASRCKDIYCPARCGYEPRAEPLEMEQGHA